MIEVYDKKEEGYVMINVSKITVIYHSFDRKSVLIDVDGLEYPIRTTESYSDVKNKVEGVTNVR